MLNMVPLSTHFALSLPLGIDLSTSLTLEAHCYVEYTLKGALFSTM
jgi:hypothetical protein